MSREIQLEGYCPEEILQFSDEELDSFVFCNESLVFRVGTAEVLGEFRIEDGVMEIELAHIDGGGEGILPTLWTLAERYAVRRRVKAIDWYVHALTCAKPNLKLRRVMEKKGFQVKTMKNGTEVLHLRNEIP